MPVTPYLRQANFVSFEASNPTDPKPGTDLDAEFDAVKVALDNAQANAQLIQRDDGKLANESVHVDALDPAAFAALAAEVTAVAEGDLQAFVDEAEDAATAAAASATSAGTSATNATTQATAAGTSAAAAATSATNAGTSATSAADAAEVAGTESVNAANAAVAAEDWADYAQSWANAANGVEVSPGLYSARHWAQQAASSVTGAMAYMGLHSAAGGVFPSATQVGQYWKISAGGTMGGVVFDTNDSLIYNGSGFDKLDNTENVSSVAGRTGAVTLTNADISGLGSLALKNQAAWASDISGIPATFTPSGHQHNASDITAGTMATARLGSGSANSSSFLRGDQVYTNNLAGDLTLTAGTTETRSLNVGQGRTGDGIATLDLIGDATYTDFGARFVRNGTANGTTQVIHRGTGSLSLIAQDNAAIGFSTQNTQRAYINGAGLFVAGYGINVSGGLDFGSNVVTGTDLSSHISLHGSANYGFNVQAGTLAYHVGASGKHAFNVVGVEWFRIDAAGSYFKNANSTTMTRQPRTFVQSADPGAAAADGDLWFW
jgi:hypothetical protein